MPFLTAFLDIKEQNTCFYGCLNLSLYIFIRKIISMAFRFLLLFHFTYNGVSLLSFWLSRYPCRQAFWNLLQVSFTCNFRSGRSRQHCMWLLSCEKMTISRSSPSQMLFKIGALKNFALFTWKHLCWSLSLIKLLDWRPATLLKEDSNTGVFLWIMQNF